MKRLCDGQDDNLTQDIPKSAFDPQKHTLSTWNVMAPPTQCIIRCACGLEFDDVDREVVYPHRMLH